LPCAPREGNRGRQRPEGRDDDNHPERGVESARERGFADGRVGGTGDFADLRDQDRRNDRNTDCAADLAHGFEEARRQTRRGLCDTGQCADLHGWSAHSAASSARLGHAVDLEAFVHQVSRLERGKEGRPGTVRSSAASRVGAAVRPVWPEVHAYLA
jgi:hypothetical protein